MAAAAVQAGLLRVGQVEGRLDALIRSVEQAYLSSLDEVDRPKAVEFLQKSGKAAEDQ